MVDKFNITVKVRNNYILHRMQLVGIDAVAELSRQSGVGIHTIYDIINMKASAFTETGKPRDVVEKLATALRCLPEDLFPEELLRNSVKSNRREFTTDQITDAKSVIGSSVYASIEPPEKAVLRQEAIGNLDKALSTLSDVDRYCVERYFFTDDNERPSMADIGQEVYRKGIWAHPISVERVRQRIAKSLRKLHHPNLQLRTSFEELTRG